MSNSLITEPLGLFGWSHLESVILAALASESPMLLIGKHGSAKSFILERLAESLGLDFRCYNASLINYDDLVGIPVPVNNNTSLSYISKPNSIWDAEVVFIDELNRTKPELQNKLFPIIYDKRVQGTNLIKLKYRWAAMNPPSKDDDDEDELSYIGAMPLDPALADRFPFIIEVPTWEDLNDADKKNMLFDNHLGKHEFPVDIYELIKKTKELINECHKRKETIGNNGFKTSRRQNNQHFPYILLVIDEYADIANKELNNALLELMKDGFKYGIHVILSTQRISGWVADIDFFKSFKTIVCQSNYDEKETRALIGDYVELNGSGDSLVLRDGELTRTQGLYISYNGDLSAKVDEYVMSMETWVFEILAKHNEEVLVPVNDNGELIIEKKTITIFNVKNYLKADKLDKHRKIKMKFWTLMKMIRGKRYSIRLENGNYAYYSCRMYEVWYNKF